MYAKLRSRLLREKEPLLLLGQTRFRGRTRSFGMYQADRLRHTWIIGKTGAGKSTLLLNLLAQDLAQGHGLALLDPHGDLVATTLRCVPAHRGQDVVLVDPSDEARPVSFNVFRAGREAIRPSQVASQLLSTFKKQWSDSWGPRLEHILRNAVLAVAEDPRATLLLLYRFLTDETERARIVERLQDSVVRAFWTREFVAYGTHLQAEAMAPVLNKVGAFIANPLTRHIVSQERSRLDFVRIMDKGQLVLADLSTGKIGEDPSRLLGGLLLAALQLAAMRRASGSCPFYIYIDEFQNFVTDALATMLAEARKFGLGLLLSHQYLGQLPPGLAAAVRGNVGTIVAFRLGAEDADALSPEFEPTYTALDLASTPARMAVMKLLIDGTQSTPFLADMLPPPAPPQDAADVDRIRALSRERYCRPVEAVVEQLRSGFARTA